VDECKPLPLAACSVSHGTKDFIARFAITFRQGLTLVHFSAQLEPCLTHKNAPKHPLNTGYTTPTRTPYPIKTLKLS
jgi:hypothetical protein